MALKIPLKGFWLHLRQTSAVDAWVARNGPSARRVPQVLRGRVVHQDSIAALPRTRVWRFAPAEDVRPQRPASDSNREIRLLPLWLRPRRLPPPFVARIEGAWLVGRHATPFTREGAMLLTPFTDRLPLLGIDEHADLVRWARDERWAQPPRAEEGEWDGEAVCSLVGRLDVNYFHWIIDICGQLEALGTYRERAGEEPRILIRAKGPAFVRQSLQLLGFDQSRLLEWPLAWAPGQRRNEEGSELVARRVGRLVVPSWRNYEVGQSPRSLLWLRRTFLQACHAEEGGYAEAGEGKNVDTSIQAGSLTGGAHVAEALRGPRLYLHRAPGGWRWVENGDEVCEFLKSRGFEIVRPEAMSFPDQVRLFASASLIVGMHGAGLANILFAPRARLVEFIGSYGSADYLFMAQILGNQYTRVACRDCGENIVVDLSKLGHALESVG